MFWRKQFLTSSLFPSAPIYYNLNIKYKLYKICSRFYGNIDGYFSPESVTHVSNTNNSYENRNICLSRTRPFIRDKGKDEYAGSESPEWRPSIFEPIRPYLTSNSEIPETLYNTASPEYKKPY